MDFQFKIPLFSLLVLFAFFQQTQAFGAGNIASISRIEGQNWRHGDIEDALLTLFLARVAGGRKFNKLDVQRVYFGNWLRDYSQAVDVGTLKYVSTEAIRILIWVLGFLSFGYGTKEFEVTTERLGCYEPTEHIDNPLGYAEGEDARDYDPRLRGPVEEERELSIDPRTGLKNYIASEDLGIATSAGLVRRVFHRSIQLARRYASSRNDEDLHEALRLLGTGLHCLEDYAAHSNYAELSLIELGEVDVFPHVGRDTKVEIRGAQDYVYPIITGTFGGVDFFHSVLGELSDKATQSEVQSLEGVMAESQNGTPSESFIQELLGKIPDGLIGDTNGQADKMNEFKSRSESAKETSQQVSPREPEEWTRYLDDVHQQIYPILEWHDNLIKSINSAIEKIPVLPELVAQIQEQITIFVFSVIAPYVLPVLQQVKTELQTGSSEVIQSSKEKQHIVFDDDSSSNPTHSMLSKDHFSNLLNEPAGRVASQVVKWAVPQLMECWDNEDIDVDRTLDRIISGVFHHPALRAFGEDGASDVRQAMFGTIEEWWHGKSEEEKEMLREHLSRDGVYQGKNHREGVHDSGHGCGKPLSIQKHHTPNEEAQADDSKFGKFAAEATGGGSLGGLVGGLVSGVSSVLLNNSSDRPQTGDDEQRRPSYHDDSRLERGDDRPDYGYGHQQAQERYDYSGRSDYVQSQSEYTDVQYRESQVTFISRRDEYSSEHVDRHYEYESRPRYEAQTSDDTESRYPAYESEGGRYESQESAPRYTRDARDRYGDDEYSREGGAYSNSNSEYVEGSYGYGGRPRYDANPRGYDY
ncbi:Het-C domain-containing protein [Aspergillus affinis]|uniref:Het-C domain-containing protein n=1 Tax=Aspergillus affinis TaxID=1070780 RepID=UPI0022FE43A1|nr:Het-C-domain-containing protein [Aspergillus affinis]KAI9039254.1 Het-C-domain-containing protein [Aspergillus affinis]